MRWLAPAALSLLTLALGGCALERGLFGTVGPDYAAPAAQPPAWQVAASPAHGASVENLKAWWSRFDDPILTDLVTAAQRESASVAQAAARIERARADAVAAGAVGNPSLDLTAAANRSAFSFGGPAVLRSLASVGAQSEWEIDLFGGRARGREAARAQLDASLAGWHDARVAVAAEVATAYVNYRFCEMQVMLAGADARSRAETARLTDIAARAGLQSAATLALARASAADGAAAQAQRETECALSIKALIALTAEDEAGLKARIAAAPALAARMPTPPAFGVEAVPARTLAQRPDIAAAERDVAAASAEIGVAEAERYPRLTLSGNVTPSRSRLDGNPAIRVTTWSIGPAAVLPVIDGGRRAANVEAARAQYKAAEAQYRARVRQAVREVEEALVRLAGLDARMKDTRAAAAGYRTNLEAAQIRYKAGLASLAEVEDARRTSLAAEGAIGALQYEGVSTWIALYRAVGGGWDGRLETGR